MKSLKNISVGGKYMNVEDFISSLSFPLVIFTLCRYDSYGLSTTDIRKVHDYCCNNEIELEKRINVRVIIELCEFIMNRFLPSTYGFEKVIYDILDIDYNIMED